MVSTLGVVTVASFLSVFLMILHALLIKDFQWFPACMYILSGDAAAGIGKALPPTGQPAGSITLSANWNEMPAGPGELSSYSAPAAHIYAAILTVFALVCMFHLAVLVKTALFSQLRVIEVEHLYEWAWMSASECFLAMTIFKDELDVRFVLKFAGLLILKGFHWIARDRVDYVCDRIRFLLCCRCRWNRPWGCYLSSLLG